MGNDLDERQERITLALYGGVFSALAFLVVGFLFYLQIILPLLGQLSALQTDPSLAGGGAVVRDPASDPAAASTVTVPDSGAAQSPALLTTTAESATPRTEFFLFLVATLPGAAMVGWALCSSWRRGLLLAVVGHLVLIPVGVVWITPETGGLDFILSLYLLPVVLVPILLLPQRILPSFFIPIALALLGFLLLLQLGWWIVPLTWVALPIAGAIAAARATTVTAAAAAA